MKQRHPTGRAVRYAILAAVAAAGAAMFIAVARTKFLPASYLAILALVLISLAAVIALVLVGGKRFRLCTGAVLAVLYVLIATTGFTLARRTQTVLEAAITPSPTFVAPATATPAPTPTAAPTATAAPTPEPTPESEFPESFVIYISGIDSREGLVPESFSDVNILCTVNRKTHQVLLVTTPRDTYVPLPFADGAWDKLTHVGQFGIDALKDTLEYYYDIDIDYWFRVGFGGFKQIVDALGGIDVYSDNTFTSGVYDFTAGSYDFYEGENQMDGDKALVFARERKVFPDGDSQRGRDQMRIMEGMIKKVLSPDLLENYSDILDALEGNFETTVPYDLLAEMVRDQLEDGSEWNVVRFLVYGYEAYRPTYLYPDSGNLYTLSQDTDAHNLARSMILDVLDGKIVEQPSTTP